MKIESINGQANPVFLARISYKPTIAKKIKNTEDGTEELVSKISEALKNHPSDVMIKTDIIMKNGLYGVRGQISSRHAMYRDVEPVENNGLSPIKNILRRILDPENKNCFNNIVGKNYSEFYDSWWAENISPVWSDISEKFRSKFISKDNHDKEFNQDFQEHRERTWYNLINK